MLIRSQALRIPASCNRHFSDVVFGPDSGQLQEIIDRNVNKNTDLPSPGPTLLTTRREALGLYREILRYSRLFVWNDDTGKPWRDVIRKSARQEFETTKHHTDPEMITRLIVTGRDSVQRITEKVLPKLLHSNKAPNYYAGDLPVINNAVTVPSCAKFGRIVRLIRQFMKKRQDIIDTEVKCTGPSHGGAL